MHAQGIIGFSNTLLGTLFFAGFLFAKQSENIGGSLFLTALFNAVTVGASSVYIFAGCLGAYFLKRVNDNSIPKEKKKSSRIGLSVIIALFSLQLINAAIMPKVFPTREDDCRQVYELTKNDTALAKCWHNLAVMTQETKYCDNIIRAGVSGEISRNSCYAYVAFGKKTDALCQQADDLIECYSSLAQLQRDPTACQVLLTEDRQECIKRFKAWNVQRKNQ